jgi:hypothetical protein
MNVSTGNQNVYISVATVTRHMKVKGVMQQYAYEFSCLAQTAIWTAG